MPIKNMPYNLSGFTLIEVLIAMFLLAGGLLGFAGLQAYSLKSNLNAYQQNMASILVSDITDRMRANSDGKATYPTIPVATAQPRFECIPISAPQNSHCSPQDMAQNDLYEWRQALATTLPLGTGTIQLQGSYFTITVSWDSNRDGVTDDQDDNFQVSYQ